MSENYADTGGYKPLLLPTTGEELLPGRQYVLTPLARLILHEVYGLRGIPTICECIKAKRSATQITTVETNLETGVSSPPRIMTLEAQQATFSTYVGNKKHITFILDLKKMDELAPFYDKSHKLPAMEDEWFKHVSDQPLNVKFRGQSLRWWSKGAVESDGSFKPYMRKKTAESLDLSILD